MPRPSASGPQSRRSRNSLSPEAILDAAETVASTRLDGLTIRAVAEELGSSPMSLYRYVAGKEELVETLLDRVLGRMPALPETEDPLADLRAFATAHRDLLLAHPWAVPGLIAHPLPGPNALPIGEQALRLLHRLGLDGDRAVATFSGIIALNYGWVSFAIARTAAEAAPSLERITSGASADFPYTVADGAAMARFGSDDHYVTVVDELTGALTGALQSGQER
ncbi:TetR/AcrR family transcriptional regulator [Microbacterium pumilum]|uniref:TetR/AcrR family transcriptional regulator C-terminal domain-containing protein n=1 Tax=Microbacterium pumilum TaxID=344165 RepID=A0ABN2STB2_9MICO